jgi:GNAT superfamily N-acetyltransferase
MNPRLLTSAIMEPTHTITLEAKPHPNDINTIVNGLFEFNQGQTGGATFEYLLATVRDGQGAVVGGLFGATYLGWLQVQAVWIPDSLRGHKYGTQLMALAENEALRRGCTRVFLETYSFQALPFYVKCGYVVHSHISDFPVGGARYALTKNLARAA